MNSRERFRETMRFGSPDRVPFLEEGLRDDVLERWHAEALPEDADLAQLFALDRRERIAVDTGFRPALEKWPTSLGELDALRRASDADDPGRLPEDWAERVAAWHTRDHLLELPIHSGFFLSLGVHDWARALEVLYQVHDAPSVLREILEIKGELCARLAERILREVEVDLVTFSEPIGGNDRPLLSPRTYEEMVLPTYRPILEVLRRHGVETVVFMTYANARPLLPAVVREGFNCLWACEVESSAMDYRDIRREFGRGLRLIGGIDLDVLLQDENAIRREMEEKVPPLLAQGGYIPLADGRVRPTMPYRNYVYYRRLLEALGGGVVGW